MGLFGGVKDLTPSSGEYFERAKDYYASYKQWTDDETKRYTRDISMNNARYGASGGNSPMLEKVNAARKTTYEESMKGLERGEHGSFLTAYFNDLKNSALSELNPTTAGQNPMTAKGGYEGRGASMFGGGKYFDSLLTEQDRQTMKDYDAFQQSDNQRRASGPMGDKYQSTNFEMMTGDRRSAGQRQTQFEQQKSQVETNLQGTKDRINALTMDEVFEPVFGTNAAPNKEQKAIDSARRGGSGGRVERSAWWG